MGNSIASAQRRKTPFIKCLPSTKLVTLPKTMNAAAGDLVTYFHAKPPGKSKRHSDIARTTYSLHDYDKHAFLEKGYSLPVNTPEEQLFWWTDIDFIPLQDNCLFISVGAYIHRPQKSPLKPSPLLQGLIYVFSFTEGKNHVEVLKGSRTSALPNISVHPSGECILYVGTGEIHLTNFFSMRDLTKTKGANLSSFQCSAQSPSGYSFAYVSRLSNKVELGFYHLDGGIFLIDGGIVDCDKLYPGFKADGSFTERYQCKFSKDSKYVAASSSIGYLIVVSYENQELLCAVSPGLVGWHNDRLANERSFDFDPRYSHEKMAFGSDACKVYFCDIDDATIEDSIDLDGDGQIQCVRYSPSGKLLAVAFALGVIRLLDPDTRSCSLTLDAVTITQDAALRSVHGQLAQVVQMAYTTHAEHLAVSYTDGYIRMWKLNQDINLQDICSRLLLKLVGFSLLRKLPLPGKIVDAIVARYTT